MDGNLAGLIFITALLFGKASLDRRSFTKQITQNKEEDDVRWADLMIKVQELESSLNRDFLLREPHMEKHKAIEQQFRSLNAKIATIDEQIKMTIRSHIRT